MSTNPLAPMCPDPSPGATRAVLTATELRQVAEWAHSVRGSNMCMVVAPRLPGERLCYTPMPQMEGAAFPPEYIVIPIDTEDRVKDRRGICEMKLTLKDKRKPDEKGKEVDFFKRCHDEYGSYPDAMFWTESSVEKFLVPYYASVHSSDDGLGDKMGEIADAFDGKPPKPKPRTEGEAQEPDEGEVTVYAMVHLPKSEYVASPPDPTLAKKPTGPALGVLYTATPADSNAAPELKIRLLPLT